MLRTLQRLRFFGGRVADDTPPLQFRPNLRTRSDDLDRTCHPAAPAYMKQPMLLKLICEAEH
jgi:hypothetical protein